MSLAFSLEYLYVCHLALILLFAEIKILISWGLEAVKFDWVVEASNADFWTREVKYSSAAFISSVDFKEISSLISAFSNRLKIDQSVLLRVNVFLLTGLTFKPISSMIGG